MSGIRILQDRSVKVTFSSLKELDDASLLLLIRRQTSTGWLLYSERQQEEQDIPQDPLSTEIKSPSARLRGALYVLWTRRYPDHASRVLNTFDAYYRATLEGFIEKTKSRIAELEQTA